MVLPTLIMTDMHRKNPGRALNFLHVWYGVELRWSVDGRVGAQLRGSWSQVLA